MCGEFGDRTKLLVRVINGVQSHSEFRDIGSAPLKGLPLPVGNFGYLLCAGISHDQIEEGQVAGKSHDQNEEGQVFRTKNQSM